MITLENVSMSFGAQEIFSDISFSISKGEKVGLAGRNGTGKSTLLKLIMEKLQPDSGKITKPRSYIIGYLEQYLKFTENTSLDELCTVLPEDRIHESWKAYQMLEGLGFKEADITRNPNALSGGLQIKLNLAKLLFSQPDMLILDEPTNYLDIYAIRWLKDFLKDWPSEILLVTHDQGFMDDVITHTILLHRGGSLKSKGNTKHMYEKVAQGEEIYEKTRQNEEKKQKEMQEWIDRFKAKAAFSTRVQSRVKFLEKQDVKEKLRNIDGLDFEFNYKEFGSKKPILEVEKLCFSYPDGPMLIKNVDLKVSSKDRICIIGENGKGKSTLLNLIAGNLTPISGEVLLHEKALMGFFGQTNIQRLNPEVSIVDELQSVDPRLTLTRIMQVCGNMMFSGDLAKKQISVLSGGEKSRVMLGKILLQPLNLLLLDEPTNHLDMDSSNAFLKAMQDFEGAIIMVTHSEYMLEKLATKLIVFEDNHKISSFDGTYKDFLRKK